MPPKDRIDHTRSTAVTSDSGALGLNRFMRSFVFFMPRIANSAKAKNAAISSSGRDVWNN